MGVTILKTDTRSWTAPQAKTIPWFYADALPIGNTCPVEEKLYKCIGIIHPENMQL